MGRLAVGVLSLTLAGTAACGSSDPSGPASAEPLAVLQPPCEHPAPLLGAPDPRAPGFIVVFHATIEAELETARLAAAYGFQPRYVWTAALEGFSADLSREVVAELRCVSSVDFVEHDQVYTLD
jgi:hypothetical protein